MNASNSGTEHKSNAKSGNPKAGFGRGLAGGVRRHVAPEERAVLAELRPDPQTKALLETLDAPLESGGAPTRAEDAVEISRTSKERASDSARDAVYSAPPATIRSERAGQGSGRVVELLPVDAVGPSPHQARRVFADIDELADSIQATGLQHPILVRKNAPGAEKPYALVFGERRHRAFGRLQGHEDPGVRAYHVAIPAFVLEYHEISDAKLAVLTAEENAQRSQLIAWELARNVVELKTVLDEDEGRPVTFERLGRHFSLQAGSTNEYYTIGAAFPEAILRKAGLTRGDDIDWTRVGALKKQRLLTIAKKPAAERVTLLRAYAGADGSRRGQRTGPRFSVEQLRAQGGFTLKIEKPVSSASYTRTQGESFLRDLEPALALLAEIAGEGRAAYRPSDGNLPGTYLVLRDQPDRLSAEERQEAIELLDALRHELARS